MDQVSLLSTSFGPYGTDHTILRFGPELLVHTELMASGLKLKSSGTEEIQHQSLSTMNMFYYQKNIIWKCLIKCNRLQ